MVSQRSRNFGGGGWRGGPPRRPVRPVRRPRRVQHKTWSRLKRRWTIIVRWFLAPPVRGWERLFRRLLGKEVAVTPEVAPDHMTGRR